jgi:hypothetical protein
MSQSPTEQASVTAFSDRTETGEVLENDDGVDALTPQQVKDAYARGQLMHEIIRENSRSGGRYMITEACDEVEETLSECANWRLPGLAVNRLGRGHNITRMLTAVDTDEGEDKLINVLFNRYTEHDKTEEELIAGARRALKDALGGCGMPRINVMRDRVNQFIETNEAATGGEA